MELIIDFFKIADNKKESFRLRNIDKLTAKEAVLLRTEISELIDSGISSIYIDASKIHRIDLSGINEIIHTNYQLKKAGKEFVFVYKQGGEVEKWVSTTGLEKFMTTAIVPA